MASESDSELPGQNPSSHPPKDDSLTASELSREIRDLMDGDVTLQTAITIVAEDVAAELRKYRPLAQLMSIRPNTVTAAVTNGIVDAIVTLFRSVTDNAGLDEIPVYLVRRYVAERLLPEELRDYAVGIQDHLFNEDLLPPEPVPPPGWKKESTGIWRLDPDHASYPSRWRRAERDDWQNLANDPEIAFIVESLRALLVPIQRDYLQLQEAGDLEQLAWTGGPLYTTITSELIAATEAYSGGAAPSSTVLTYLKQQVLEPEIATVLGVGPTSPVNVTFNPSIREFDLRFTDASTRERGPDINPLINEVQEAFGLRKPRPGAPTRAFDEPMAEQARTAAKLHHWLGLGYDEIASFFGWEAEPKAQRERIRRYVREGERLLESTAELGPDWARNPPPSIEALFNRR